MAESKRRFKKQRSQLFTISDTRLKKEQMTSVVWTTLLGLPIVQPYRKIHRKQIATSLQTIFISDPNSPAEGKLIILSFLSVAHDFGYLPSELDEASFGVPTKLYPQFGCYTHDADGFRVQSARNPSFSMYM